MSELQSYKNFAILYAAYSVLELIFPRKKEIVRMSRATQPENENERLDEASHGDEKQT